MSITIGLVANVFNEARALPGWLETHLPFFDDVRVLHSGPGGEYSDDGTIELLERWKIPVDFCPIDSGFGEVRTRALRMSPCDYIMLLDADERFYPTHRYLTCHGTQTSARESDEILNSYHYRDGHTPDWSRIGQLGSNLKVEVGDIYEQGQYLRWLLSHHKDDVGRPLDAVATIRRHWHDAGFLRPTQDWTICPDWQMRLVRNDPSIRFDPSTKMHERLVGASSISYAEMSRGPFFDHHHFFFKRMEEGQRAHDVRIFDAIHEGRNPPTSEDHK